MKENFEKFMSKPKMPYSEYQEFKKSKKKDKYQTKDVVYNKRGF